ncbi:MAG: dihydrolipoyllysine-residue succinyltransferase [Cocleimonas sp.]|nr:dihydrolipoyllysine-residue succinyltransferase [Cocleimonas sp.]
MSKKIRVPLLPESVNDATIAIWVKKVGENVEEEEVLLELETDKVILEVTAPASGILVEIIEDQDAIVHSGDIIGKIKTEQEMQQEPVNTMLEEEKIPVNDHNNDDEKIMVENQASESHSQENQQPEPVMPIAEENKEHEQEVNEEHEQDKQEVEPMQDQSESEIRQEILQELEQIQDNVPEEAEQELLVIDKQQHQEVAGNNDIAEIASDNEVFETIPDAPADDSPFASPSVRKAMAEYQLQAGDIDGSGKHGKILKEDIEQHIEQAELSIEEDNSDASNANDEEHSVSTDVEIASAAAEEDVLPVREGEDDVVVPTVDANPEPIAEEQVAVDSTNKESLATENLSQDIEAVPELTTEEPQVNDNEGSDMKEVTHMDENNDEGQRVDQQTNSDFPVAAPKNNDVKPVGNPLERRVPMTRLRARIAERLVEAQQNAAILTTFNDVDLSEIIRLRKIYRDRFEQVHSIKLGFMSFFVKAATEALKRYPEVNARIDGQDVIYQGNYDIGVAVSTERGLIVPIVRDTNTLGHADIEKKIHDYAHRARNNQLELNELTGGTFSITNGGVFGSMLSTPIINPPQSAILGMHKIEDRPVAINGEVVIRPMMYLALSYDHRLIDGKTAVSFLVKIKELLEDPASLFLEL